MHSRLYLNDLDLNLLVLGLLLPTHCFYFVLEHILQLFLSANPLLGFCLPLVSQVSQLLPLLAFFRELLEALLFQPVSCGALLPDWHTSPQRPSEQLPSGSAEPGFGHELRYTFAFFCLPRWSFSFRSCLTSSSKPFSQLCSSCGSLNSCWEALISSFWGWRLWRGTVVLEPHPAVSLSLFGNLPLYPRASQKPESWCWRESVILSLLSIISLACWRSSFKLTLGQFSPQLAAFFLQLLQFFFHSTSFLSWPALFWSSSAFFTISTSVF